MLRTAKCEIETAPLCFVTARDWIAVSRPCTIEGSTWRVLAFHTNYNAFFLTEKHDAVRVMQFSRTSWNVYTTYVLFIRISPQGDRKRKKGCHVRYIEYCIMIWQECMIWKGYPQISYGTKNFKFLFYFYIQKLTWLWRLRWQWKAIDALRNKLRLTTWHWELRGKLQLSQLPEITLRDFEK